MLKTSRLSKLNFIKGIITISFDISSSRPYPHHIIISVNLDNLVGLG